MHSAHRLDVRLQDLAFAFGACANVRDHASIAERIASGWSARGLACLSVRSAFDLLLGAHAWPRGDEIVFSAINVADMPRIARAHGLECVPADIDARTLVPSVAQIERVLSPRTRAIVVAQLFGSRSNLAPLAEVARRHGALLIEDCAQAFRDPRDVGAPDADVSLYSFGSIKTSSALVRVEDAGVLSRMRAAQEAWPVQSRATFRRKIVKYAALVGASNPAAYELFAKGCALLGRDLDDVTRDLLKGFSGAELLPQIRQQPSAPLLALLERRLRRFDGQRLAARAAYGSRVARELPAGLAHAGGDLASHTHWVFTARSVDPNAVTATLRRAGFHATRRGASLEAIAPPPDRAELEPVFANALMRELVFLPAYPEMPEDALARMIDVLHGSRAARGQNAKRATATQHTTRRPSSTGT